MAIGAPGIDLKMPVFIGFPAGLPELGARIRFASA
jgi:hypothetical protein